MATSSFAEGAEDGGTFSHQSGSLECMSVRPAGGNERWSFCADGIAESYVVSNRCGDVVQAILYLPSTDRRGADWTQSTIADLEPGADKTVQRCRGVGSYRLEAATGESGLPKILSDSEVREIADATLDRKAQTVTFFEPKLEVYVTRAATPYPSSTPWPENRFEPHESYRRPYRRGSDAR